MKICKRICRIVLILLFWIGVWWLAAWRVGKPLLFPSPLPVVERLAEMMHTAEFYQITANSLFNVLKGILIAVLGGCILSAITSRATILREAVLPLMTVIKATPVASFIILALIWINLDEGFLRIDPQLTEVAKIYRMSFLRRLQILILPSLRPYFVSACRTSMGLAWKAGIAAEIIAMPRNSIGTMMGDAKQYIETVDLFAWTLTVILLSLIIEFLFAALFKRFDRKPPRKEAL